MPLPSLNRLPVEGESLSPRAHRKGDYKIDPETGCWLWQKTLTKRGYGMGQFAAAGIKTNHAHRAYYIAAYGPLEPTTHVHHKCKNPPCVNPDHLEALSSRRHFLEHKLHEKTGLTLWDIKRIRQRGREIGTRAIDVAAEYGIHEITVYNYWGQEQVWADLLGEPAAPIKPVRACAYCGGTFSGRNRNAIYCCVEHRVRFNADKKLVKNRV